MSGTGNIENNITSELHTENMFNIFNLDLNYPLQKWHNAYFSHKILM